MKLPMVVLLKSWKEWQNSGSRWSLVLKLCAQLPPIVSVYQISNAHKKTDAAMGPRFKLV